MWACVSWGYHLLWICIHTAGSGSASLLNVSACGSWGDHLLCICIHTDCSWTAFLRHEQEYEFSDEKLMGTRRRTWGICGFYLLPSLSLFGMSMALYNFQWNSIASVLYQSLRLTKGKYQESPKEDNSEKSESVLKYDQNEIICCCRNADVAKIHLNIRVSDREEIILVKHSFTLFQIAPKRRWKG